jgi:RHS repeat-associated protein
MKMAFFGGSTKYRQAVATAFVFVSTWASAQTPQPLPPGPPATSYEPPLAPQWSPVNPPEPTVSVGAPDVMALSALPAAVGRTPTAFAVSKQGTANYSIPISAPPGVGNIQLKLTLSYNSRGPDGLEGMGWAITGLSSITRCAKTYAQDGAAGPVLLQQTDRLCLDGAQLKLSSGTVPNYVIAGNQFRTEIETFSQITANGSGSNVTSFTVKARDGLIYTYGGTSDSEIIAGSSGVVRTWALSKIADRVGNNIELVYQNDTTGGDPTNGSFRIDHINYPYLASGAGPYYTVQFTYGSRPAADVLSTYLSGYLIQETHQLNTISVEESGGTLIKSYTLTYTAGPTSGRQTLTSVQECSASTCLPATTIAYQPGATGWSATGTVVSIPSAQYGSGANGPYDQNITLADLNGDGQKDIVYVYTNTSSEVYAILSSSTGYGSPIAVAALANGARDSFAGNFNGTGQEQVLVELGGSLTRDLVSWSASGGTTITTLANAPYALIDAKATETIAADIDGDGLTDLIYFKTGTAGVYVQRNITVPGGAVTFAAPVLIYTAPTNYTLQGDASRTGFRQADLNGDGRADVLVAVDYPNGTYPIPSYWQPLLSNGTNASGVVQPFTAAPLLTREFDPSLGADPSLTTLLDWNGDGCTDLVQISNLYVSKCDGTFVSYALPAAATFGAPKLAADWNGDGREDIIYRDYISPTNDYWHVLQSTGAAPGADTATSFLCLSNGTDFVQDTTGDGQPEFIVPSLGNYCTSGGPTNSLLTIYGHNSPDQIPDLATSFTDGFGMNQSPTYVPLTNAGYYSKYADAVFPEEDYQGSLYVVNQFTASDGTGSTYQNQFYYYGARMQAQGRGFEGFYAQRTYDSRDLVYTYEYVQRPFPFTGMLYQRINLLAAGRNYINEWTATPNSQTQTNLGGYETGSFNFLSPETTTTWESGGPKDGDLLSMSTRTTTYGDGYGNATNVVTSTTDRDDVAAPMSPFVNLTWTSTVTTQFDIDTSDWCLNLPQTSSITNVVPGQTTQTRNSGYTVDGPHCRLSEMVLQPGPSALTVTIDYGYDTCGGNIDSVAVTGRNPDGTAMASRTTLFSYTNTTTRCQLPELITNALGQQTSLTYNYDFGVPLTSKDANNLTTTWLPDDYGRISQESRPDGTYTTWGYTACNSSNSYCGVTDLRFYRAEMNYAAGGTFINEVDDYHDGFDRLRYQKGQRVLGTWTYNVVRTYDSLGRVYYDYVPYSSATNGYKLWTYDALNRPLSLSLYNSSGSVDRSTGIVYLGRTTNITDPLGHVTQKLTDVSNRLRRIIDPAPGGTTQYAYDAFGNWVQSIDATGATSSATYNLRGFRTQMVDADAGTWNFVPDSLNELVSWTDAKTQSFSQIFDSLGRVMSRTEPEGPSTWSWGSSAALHNVGLLASVSGYGYSEALTYDTLSRLSNRSITISGDQNYQFDYTYNTAGDLATIAYPTSPIPNSMPTPGPRYTIQYQYSFGNIFEIQDVTTAGSSPTIWALGSVNDYSSPLTETIGTGAGATTITSTYKPWTDQVLSVQSASSAATLQNLAYLWDIDDNLTQRKDITQSLTEIFTPDGLNRLSSSTLNSVSNLSVTYDAAGDILSRSDVGTYTYGNSAHPHGVMAAGSNSYTYDANGNVASRNGLANTWASYNLPTLLQSSVSGSTLSSELWYGPDHQRYQQVATELNGTETTRYVGGVLEKMNATTTGLTYWRHYVNTPTGRTIVVSRNSDSSTTTNLVLSDHLGSGDAIVNGSTGVLNVQESFGAFGLRRQSNWAAGVPSYWDQVAITESTRHGFTSHEHLDNVGLIHMNGRVYDPITGRFLSVDPDPGEPGDSQRLNPYSYVGNKPLVRTDPTGYKDVIAWSAFWGGASSGEVWADGDPNIVGPYEWPTTLFIEIRSVNDTSGSGTPQATSAQQSTQAQAAGQSAAADSANVPGTIVVTFDKNKSWAEALADTQRSLDEGARMLANDEAINNDVANPPPKAFPQSLQRSGEKLKAGLKELVVIAAEIFPFIPGEGLVEKVAQKAGEQLLDDIIVTAAARGGAEIIASNGTRIAGFTRHGINRAIGDAASRAGTKPQAILDALKNPAKIAEGVDKQGRPFQIFTGGNARVVVNPETGQIVSVNPLSRLGAQ